MNILVVDDDLVCMTMMQKICERVGDCLAVERGLPAVDAFKSALDAGIPFDIITLDRSLPDLDGLDVLRQIRCEEERRAIPLEKRAKVIMVSGTSEPEVIASCTAAGCDDFIIKPFRRHTVTEVLERHIDG